jgi:adenylate kinase family enzyme
MASMNPAVLAIAGPIGSGKTTTATLLAQRLGWPHDGYGDTIRAIATARGLPASRSILQQLGVELTGAGCGTFTRLVLDHARWASGQPLILDGLRHLPAATALREAIAPLPGIIIYLDVPASTALSRARRRDQATGPGAVDVQHATELGLPTIRDHADLIIQARELEPAQVAGQVICYLAARLGRASGGRCA